MTAVSFQFFIIQQLRGRAARVARTTSGLTSGSTRSARIFRSPTHLPGSHSGRYRKPPIL